jgi:hypothetical protein
MMSGQTSGKSYIFFGWYVLSACFIILFFQSGARYAFSVMFKPMLADLGWNRTSLSGAYFLNMTLFALTMLVVNTVLCFTVIRGNPYDLGIKPYGSVRQDLPRPDTIRESPGSRPQDLGLKEALRTHSFWLFLIAMSICGSGDFLVAVHLVAFLTDIGIPFKTKRETTDSFLSFRRPCV